MCVRIWLMLEGAMLHSVLIEINADAGALAEVTDSYLASAWHVAQANPAPYGDKDAGLLVKALGDEIMRRWLAHIPADRYRHQAQDQYRRALTKTHDAGSAA